MLMVTKLVECWDPWRWVLVDGLVDTESCRVLRDSLLAAPMASKEPSPERPYSLQFIRVKLFDEEVSPQLPWLADDAWASVNYLASEAVRAQIGDLVKVDLSATWTEVNYWRWPTGSYVGAHLDRYPRVVTHVLYLNDGWADERGGNLEILRTQDQKTPSMSVLPQFGRSMLIAASHNSWHRVEPIKTAGSPRLTVSIAYAAGTADSVRALGHTRHS